MKLSDIEIRKIIGFVCHRMLSEQIHVAPYIMVAVKEMEVLPVWIQSFKLINPSPEEEHNLIASMAWGMRIGSLQTLVNYTQLDTFEIGNVSSNRVNMVGLHELLKEHSFPAGNDGEAYLLTSPIAGSDYSWCAAWADSEGAAKRFVNAVHKAHDIERIAKSMGVSDPTPFPEYT